MSTIKSSAENLTLNADGANNDIKFQSNGSEVAAIDQAGNLTVSGTVDGVDVAAAGALASAALPKAGGTMTGQLTVNRGANGDIAYFKGTDAGLFIQSASGVSSLVSHDGSSYDAVRIRSGGADANSLTVQTSGDVTVGAGDIVFGTAGKGIVLGATSNTDANTLDDYEEGTWTPTLIGTGGGTGTWASSVNTYTKVGRAVHITAYLNCTSLGNMSNGVTIGGLPFTNASAGGYQALATGAATGLAIDAGNCVTAFINVNATTIHPRLWNATTGTAAYGFYIEELSADGSLMFSGTYFAT